MHPEFTYALLLLGPFIYGLAMAALMYVFFGVALERAVGADWLGTWGKILGWFLANEAVIWAPFKVFDLPAALAIPPATGLAFLAYLCGFGLMGVGLGLVMFRRGKASVLVDLSRLLGGVELEVILLIVRYGVDPPQAAAALGLTVQEIEDAYYSALQRIKGKGDAFLKRLKDAPG